MYVEIKVRCGKPVMKVRMATLKYVAVTVVMFIVIMFIYSFYLLVYSIEIKINVSDYVSMVNTDGWIMPVTLAVPALLSYIVGLQTLYFLIRIFNQKTRNMTLNCMLYYFVWVCIAVFLIDYILAFVGLSHAYLNHEALHDGIMEAMNKYSYDSDFKRHIDILQVAFECCGSQKYNEWFDIIWYDNWELGCCSMHHMSPCIHHGIEIPNSVYIYHPETNLSLYKHGCHEMIIHKKKIVCWNIFGLISALSFLILLITIGIRMLQTAHHERGRFVEGAHVYTSWIIGCYSGKNRLLAPPVPPASPEIIDSSW